MGDKASFGGNICTIRNYANLCLPWKMEPCLKKFKVYTSNIYIFNFSIMR